MSEYAAGPWISVENDLPTYGKEVLIRVHRMKKDEFGIGFYTPSGWHSCDLALYPQGVYGKVSYWAEVKI